MSKGKKFLLKIYDRTGNKVSLQTDISLSSFSWGLNGGPSELTIRFPKQIDDFGESSEINFFYRVKVYVFDQDSDPEGMLLYQGYINSYKQVVKGTAEYVEAICLGYQTLLSRILLKSGSATTVSYSSQEIANIVKDAITKAASVVTTTQALVDNTGVTVSFTFRNNTIKDVLDKCIDLSPEGFYWRSNPDNTITFAKVDYDATDFKLNFKKDFTELEVEKSMSDAANVLYFIGGGNPNLYKKYTRTSSVTEFGTLEATKSDERVTLTATASSIAEAYLDKVDHPKVTVKLTISDNNLKRASGINIEALRPGMVVAIRGITDEEISYWDEAVWDVDFWDYDILGALANPLVIKRLTYNIDSVTLELGDFISTFARDYKSFEDRVSSLQYQNLPTTPS